MELTPQEIQRYSRHLILPEVGMDGQKKLKQASVLIIGAGGLGSPLSVYLAAAGVGKIGLVDFDIVDESNLQRQILHSTRDVGRKKLESAKERLEALNPNIQVQTYEVRFTSDNAMDIIEKYDIVVDGTDNYPTRYLVNDACVLLKKPNVYGSIFRFEGQASVFDAKNGPCYRCLYSEPPPPGLVPSCAEGGVLGILPGVIGTIQATETIKLILNEGQPLTGRLLLFDALAMTFRELKLKKNPECPICSEHPSITELIDYEAFCGIAPSNETSEHNEVKEITVSELKKRMDDGSQFQLIDVREPNEYEIAHLQGSKLIPLREIGKELENLDPNQEYILYCHFGGRSEKAALEMGKAGFKNVLNVKGGIDAWSTEVDPSVPKY